MFWSSPGDCAVRTQKQRHQALLGPGGVVPKLILRVSKFVNFSKVSCMEQRRDGQSSQANYITAPSRHLSVTESSVTLPPDPRRSIMITIHRPPCPRCKATTTLARITPGRSGFDIRTFECSACDHIYQRVVELGDPMKTPRTAGWLRGELRAPT
jgi:hypothetical protein